MADIATSRSISLNVLAKMEQFQKDMLEKIPGTTEKAAARAAAKMQSQFTAQVVKQFKDAEKGAGALGGKLNALGKQIASSVGGPLGGAAAKAFELTDKLGGATSAMGGLAAAGLAAVGTAGILTVGIGIVINRAIAAEARLDAMGKAATIPDSARESLRKYQTETEKLKTKVDSLTATLGGYLANAALLAAKGIEDLGKSTEQRATEAFFEAIEAGQGLTGVYRDIYTGASTVLGPLKVGGKVYEDTTDKVKDHTAALERDKAAFQALLESHRDFDAKKQISDTEKLLDAEKRLAGWFNQEASFESDLAAARAINDQQLIDLDNDLAEGRKENLKKWLAVVWAAEESAFEIFAAFNARKLQMVERELDREKSKRDEIQSRQERLEQRLRDADDETTRQKIRNRLTNVTDDLKSQRTLVRAARQHAKQLAKAQKASSIFGATVATARAVAEALPDIPLSILAGVLGGTQIATIAAQPLPSFFRGTSRVPTQGGSPGAQQATLHGNEAVLTDSAVERFGRTMIDFFNGQGGPQLAGAGGGGGGGIVLDEVQLDRALARRVRAGGALTVAVKGGGPTGYRSPFGRN